MEGAEAAYRRADERGDAFGAVSLGLVLEERGDVEGAEAAYRRADERGDATGAFNLGGCWRSAATWRAPRRPTAARSKHLTPNSRLGPGRR